MMAATLKQILKGLYNSVELQNGKPCHRNLSNGLRISLRTDKERNYILMLSRLEVYPSFTEMFTVLECLPHPISYSTEVRRQKYKRWHSVILRFL